jgi:quinol monooxygenase YgiN
MPVVRISKGAFQPENFETIKVRLDESQKIVPDVQKLNGCLYYWAGIDPVSNTMVNVSVWRTLADAKQMDTLAPMLALAKEFTNLGVVFERPICNYETLWEI